MKMVFAIASPTGTNNSIIFFFILFKTDSVAVFSCFGIFVGSLTVARPIAHRNDHRVRKSGLLSSFISSCPSIIANSANGPAASLRITLIAAANSSTSVTVIVLSPLAAFPLSVVFIHTNPFGPRLYIRKKGSAGVPFVFSAANDGPLVGYTVSIRFTITRPLQGSLPEVATFPPVAGCRGCLPSLGPACSSWLADLPCFTDGGVVGAIT
jgi:hypothetical protein